MAVGGVLTNLGRYTAKLLSCSVSGGRLMNTILMVIIVVVALLLLLQLWMRLSARRQRGQALPNIDGLVAEELRQGERQLYYFFSPTCGPCRALAPVIDQLADEFPGVIKVDITQQLDVARRFSVRATPTVVLVVQGTIMDVLLGGGSEAKLRAFLQEGVANS